MLKPKVRSFRGLQIERYACWRVVAGVRLATNPWVYATIHQSVQQRRREQKEKRIPSRTATDVLVLMDQDRPMLVLDISLARQKTRSEAGRLRRYCLASNPACWSEGTSVPTGYTMISTTPQLESLLASIPFPIPRVLSWASSKPKLPTR
jgi:hypothetical protein